MASTRSIGSSDIDWQSRFEQQRHVDDEDVSTSDSGDETPTETDMVSDIIESIGEIVGTSLRIVSF